MIEVSCFVVVRRWIPLLQSVFSKITLLSLVSRAQTRGTVDQGRRERSKRSVTDFPSKADEVPDCLVQRDIDDLATPLSSGLIT